MRWTEGQGRNLHALPAGERNDRLAVVPSNGVAEEGHSVRDPESRRFERQGCLSLLGHGVRHLSGLNRAYVDWKAANDQGMLKTTYEGVVACLNSTAEPVTSCRDCVTPAGRPHASDALLRHGDSASGRRGPQGGEDLIGSYHYRDLVTNPKFSTEHFSTES